MLLLLLVAKNNNATYVYDEGGRIAIVGRINFAYKWSFDTPSAMMLHGCLVSYLQKLRPQNIKSGFALLLLSAAEAATATSFRPMWHHSHRLFFLNIALRCRPKQRSLQNLLRNFWGPDDPESTNSQGPCLWHQEQHPVADKSMTWLFSSWSTSMSLFSMSEWSAAASFLDSSLTEIKQWFDQDVYISHFIC